MKKMKYLILAMIIVIIIIIITIVVLLMKKDSTNSQETTNTELEEEQEEYIETLNNPGYAIVGLTPEKITYPSIYFSVEACMEKVVEYITANNNEAIYNVLNTDYIEENQITTTNLLSKTELNLIKDYEITEIYEITGTNYSSYYIKGITNSTYMYFNMNWDMSNGTFDIQILSEDDYEYYINHSIDENEVASEEKQIEENNYNTIQYVTMTNEEIARMYYEKIIELELNTPEEAYESLDEEYREERFGSLEEYLYYVEEYKEVLELGILSKYSTSYENEDYIEYTLVDTYNNTYILKATSVMEYTIKLDDYTIKNENYTENYNNLTDKNKVSANVYIFLKMINTKDYKHAYNLLNDTFKENNFNNLEEFKNYITNSFCEYNIDTEEATIKEEGDYYIYTTTIKDSNSTAAETKELTLIVRLLDGTDFELSFSID